MGAWRFWRRHFGDRLLDRFPWTVVARPESASPAGGSSAQHHQEQHDLAARALG